MNSTLKQLKSHQPLRKLKIKKMILQSADPLVCGYSILKVSRFGDQILLVIFHQVTKETTVRTFTDDTKALEFIQMMMEREDFDED